MTFDEQVDAFAALYAGSVRSFGQYDPKKHGTEQQHYTVKQAPTRDDFARHLRGERGIGIVPIQRDKYSSWGVIDIDVDGIDIIALEQAVRAEEFPLIVCRSKSGRAHLYLFLRETVLATAVRAALQNYAKALGYPGVEIFPKQNETSADILGSWINLPYFGCAAEEKLPEGVRTRPSIEGGKEMPLSFFLEHAKNIAVSRSQLFSPKTDHAEAPPCVISMIHNGLGPGMRNEGMFSIAVYIKRAFPESWRDKLQDINAGMADPLPAEELRKTIINSIARKDFLYKCKLEPCKSLCDSNVCVTRKYGITPAEQKTIINVEAPVFGKLRKYTTEPVYWEMEVNGSPVRLTTEDLAFYKKLQLRVMEWQTRMLPAMKDGDWHVILDGLMAEAEVIEAPDEASAPGQVRQALREFIEKAHMLDNAAERENLMRGMPVIEEDGGKTIAIFTGTSFQKYLKDQRKEEVRGANLWMALRRMKVEHKRIRVAGGLISVWWCELEDGQAKLAADLTIPDFKTEF